MNKCSICLLALLATACSQEEIVEIANDASSDTVQQIVMTAEDFRQEAGTRTTLNPTTDNVEFTWAENDTVGIYPERGDQVSFPMSTGANTNTAYFDGGAWALKASAKYAAYYPFSRANFNRSSTSLPLRYTGQRQTGDASTAHLGAYDYMAASAVTPAEGQVTFAFKHLNSLLQLKLTVPAAATYQSLTLTTDEDLLAWQTTLNLQTKETTTSAYEKKSSLTMDLADITCAAPNQTLTLYMMLAPVNLTGKTLTANLLDTDGNSYAVSFDGKNFEAGCAYALTGTMAVSEAVTVANLSAAGTLASTIGTNNLQTIKALKIIGEVNGDDILTLRRMEYLEYLNMEDSKIVEGGSANSRIKTTNDALGSYFFQNCPIKKFICPKDITSIGDHCFDYTPLESIVIPESVTSIGRYAFSDCRKLIDINLPNKLTTIGDCAFIFCYLLPNVSLPTSVTSIGSSAFSNCESFTSVTIPQNVTIIGNAAYIRSSNIEEVHIKAMPETLTSIAENSFNDVYDKATLYIPKGTRDAYMNTALVRFTNIVEE